MYLAYHTTSIHEVPGEISLVLGISGCPNGCKNCHSPELQQITGYELTNELFEKLINKYKNLITCVCFMGGDHEEENLIKFLKKIKIKKCLYTGKEYVSENLKQHLDFLKINPYIPNYGGLDCTSTNQRFYHIPSKTDLTNLFHHRA